MENGAVLGTIFKASEVYGFFHVFFFYEVRVQGWVLMRKKWCFTFFETMYTV